MAEVLAGVGLVLAAGVSGLAAILVARLRTENTDQHAANLERLAAIGDDVSEVRTDVRDIRQSHTRHLEWHAEKRQPG